MAAIASAGRLSSSALSRIFTNGFVASSQNCCRRLADRFARRALVETVVEITGSNLGHFSHLDSGTPYFVARAFLVALSSFDLNAVSIKAPAASDS